MYGSLTPELSLAEALAATRTLGVPDEQALPKVSVAGRAELRRVLRLEARARHALRVGVSELLAPDWKLGRRETLSQCLGRLAAEAGFEGVIVPSSVLRSGENLVAFPDALLAGSRLVAVGSGDGADRPDSERGPGSLEGMG